MPTIITEGTGRPAVHGGWAGELFPALPDDLRAQMMGAYLLGLDYVTSLPSSAARPELGDLTLQGLDLTAGGNPVPEALFTTGGAAAYYDTPITGDALAAAGTPGACGFWVVAKDLSAGCHLMSCYNGNQKLAFGMGRAGSGSLQIIMARDGASSITGSIPYDADADARWAMYFGVWTEDGCLLRRWTSAGMTPSNPSADPGVAPGGLSRVRIFRSVDSAFTGGCKIAAAGPVTGAWSQTEQETFYTAVADVLGDYGLGPL